MERTQDGTWSAVRSGSANEEDYGDGGRCHEIVLPLAAVERDFIFWLDALPGNGDVECEHGIGPLDLWEQQWSQRLLPRLRDQVRVARLQRSDDAKIGLKLTEGELGYLACRMLTVKRVARMLFHGDRNGFGRVIRLGTLPETWQCVLDAVTPTTPYPALAPREWLTSGVAPFLAGPQPECEKGRNDDLLTAVQVALATDHLDEVLIVAPLGEMVQLHDLALHMRDSAISPGTMQRSERALSALGVTLASEVINRVRRLPATH